MARPASSWRSCVFAAWPAILATSYPESRNENWVGRRCPALYGTGGPGARKVRGAQERRKDRDEFVRANKLVFHRAKFLLCARIFRAGPLQSTVAMEEPPCDTGACPIRRPD